MRLFHVSEDPNITLFHPRKPTRADRSDQPALVWALCERTLPNFLTPRDCPRVTYHVSPHTLTSDILKHCSHPDTEHVVVIEHDWVERMHNTTLYVYEFDPEPFILQDVQAGYYVSTKTIRPIARHVMHHPFQALASFAVEIRIVENLWPLCQTIQASTFYWSMCRMAHAKPQQNKNL